MDRNLTDAIAYCRVSTEGQVASGHALERYIASFLDFGFSDDQIYWDIDSGGNNEREGYLKVLEKVKQGVKRVYVPELTRFSRSVKGFEEAIELLSLNGAKLLTLDGHDFDLITPTGLTNTRIMMAFAEQDRLIRRHHAIAGLKKRREDGKPLRPLFGYLMGKDQLVPNQNQYRDTGKTYWQVARELFELFLDCQNFSQTALIMCDRYGTNKISGAGGDFPRTTMAIKYWLSCQYLRGNTEYYPVQRYGETDKNRIVYDTHQPLISPSESIQIDLIFKSISKVKTNLSRLTNPFVDLAFCVCGGKMFSSCAKTSKSTYHYLVCKNAHPRTAKEKAIEIKCEFRYSYGLTLDKLEMMVIEAIKSKTEAIADLYFDQPDESVDPRLAKIDIEIAKIESLAQEIPELKSVLIKKQQERSAILAASSANQSDRSYLVLKQKLIEYGQDDRFWQNATVMEKRELFNSLVERIDCDRGQVTIKWLI